MGPVRTFFRRVATRLIEFRRENGGALDTITSFIGQAINPGDGNGGSKGIAWSRATAAGIAVGVVALLSLFGIDIGTETLTAIIFGGGLLVSSFYTIKGRVGAKTPVRLTPDPKE